MYDLDSEFWWVPEETDLDSLVVGVAYQRPIGPRENPYKVPWYQSLDGDKPSIEPKLYPLLYLGTWAARWNGTNVHRSLTLFDSVTRVPKQLGPFLIDIDNEEGDVAAALRVVSKAVRVLLKGWGLTEEDVQVWFSGQKGFHLEVRPSAVGIDGAIEEQVERSWQWTREMISALHDGHGSANNTVDPHGQC